MNTLEPIVINTSEISLTMSCEDIYEALRFCAIEKKCTRCPLFSITDCDAVLMPAVFEMVKRQKAEIEKLKAENAEQDQAIINALHRMKVVRAEAIKKFAERLKGDITINNTEDGYLIYSIDYGCLMEDIDNLVKEMTEGEDA